MKVLISGTSSGIGRETAILFLKEGHSVVGLDIKNRRQKLHPLYS